MPEVAEALVVGSINMDLVLEVEAPPRPGETVLAKGSGLLPGGKGANQAVAASRLGLKVRMVGLVGDDAVGTALLAGLEAEGVLTETVGRVQGMSGMAAISLTPDGENAITVAQGANAALGEERILALPEEVFGCRVMLLQLEVPVPAGVAAARRARRAGALVLLNPSPPQRELRELLALSDWLVPNRLEAEILTGHADPAAAARALLALGPQAVFVTLGGQGALVVTSAGERLVAPPQVEPVDTTGAGDAFLGALAYAYCQDQDPFAAAALAAAAGAAATQRRGAQAALPTLSDLQGLAHTG